jgi:hypothetical protein
MSVAQRNGPKRIAQFPGASLKRVPVAKPEFERRKLDVDKYIVVVYDLPDSVYVILKSPDEKESGFGSRGKYPDYPIEIRKKDSNIVSSAYEK